MQFHLDGFRPGNPEISDPASKGGDPGTVDVLIVGCGPAGLTLAAQLAAFADIKTRIIEQKDGPLQLGQADGVACRTMEMFEAFGFCHRVMKEAYWVNEVAFWQADEARPENIVRNGRVQDVEDGLSEMPHVILNQARVHDFYLEFMRNAPTRLEPDYGCRLLELNVEAGGGDYPVLARLEVDGEEQTVRARYAVGCDGARSTVRRALDMELTGDSANQAWGVMDVLAVTDFPDIRLKTVIHSSKDGTLLIIPREGGYLARFYIELDKLGENERASSRNIGADDLVQAARRIFHPYKLEVKEIAWWSVYEIGQRLCDRFDDGVDGTPHVFIAGDACHTHSPKAGQGMNVSMQDSFNLGWKLASVLRGQADPYLLRSYSAERQAVATELIDFDRELALMIGGRHQGANPDDFRDYFVRHGRYTAGTATRYQASIIQAEARHQDLAAGFPIGMRFHSAPVIRLADARPLQLGHVIKADGRWRLFAFAGAKDRGDAGGAIAALCLFLQESRASPLRRYTRAGANIDSVIDVRAIFQQGHRELAVERLPALLLPEKGRLGLRDYEKAFCPDLNGGQDIFAMRGIDREQGCLLIVRPDQYVAHILPLTAHDELGAFFAGFMLPAH